MIGKITSGVISRRMALSVLGSPLALGFAAASPNAEAERASALGCAVSMLRVKTVCRASLILRLTDFIHTQHELF
jgi:hypothetical protein